MNRSIEQKCRDLTVCQTTLHADSEAPMDSVAVRSSSPPSSAGGDLLEELIHLSSCRCVISGPK
jgi:hypothetical protein